ncbi:type VII secretion-associated serine protease mycosin [Kribbella rubisoli]|uniref:Type VII secretion-associated serine protease mycosin n=1 Tax=Kribbella rubisoli TaxID=3075929 RepID=A0A4Q7WUB1_9ACTN|nr:S8 family serine peptidase [Kribbella rubisoli]RZU13870.1 type VII secretion-associated serine protease mycosin [Kribbella rubisoli]
MLRKAHFLRLALPAALVAGSVVVVTGSSGNAAVSAEPNVRQAKFQPAEASGPKYDPKSVIVQFKPKATTSARKAAVAKVKGTPDVSVTADVVKVTGDTPAPELLKKFKADPSVELASLNYFRQKSAIPNDWLYANYQKYLSTVRVDKAWDLSKSAGNQTIGVLDTGVDAGHPDLAGHLLPGYNTFNTALPPNDGDGHGTATTGIIAAGTSNSLGIAGVAWNAKVRPVKVLDDTGSGDDTNVINGINWAVKNGVRVINMSLGGEGDDPILHTAIQNAVAKGVVLVAAAGNTGDSSLHYPAAYPEVLSVGATNAAGVLTSFSTYGDSVDLAAPGYDITSTSPRAGTPAGYEPYFLGLAGTSFSSPIVAGVAALVRNKWPTFTPAQVMARLKATARDAGPRGNDPYYGAGILDAYAALGGAPTTDFAMGAADKNDQPARAGELIAGVAASGTISVEGDVDWYKIPAVGAHQVRIDVTGAMFDSGTYAQNFGPVVSAYDADLKPLAFVQKPEPPVDSDGYEIPQALTASTYATLPDATSYISVRNANGSRDSRAYSIKVTNASGNVGTAPIPAYPVSDVVPGDLSSGVSVLAKPTVTFPRNVDENSVTNGGVKLLNGKTGAVIPATVTYDHDIRRAEISPASPLAEATPFRIVADGVVSLDPTVPMVPFTSVFSTEDLLPQPVQLVGVGAYLAANLSWTIPPTTDLDQVIIRRNVGSKAPTPTTGTLVYAGTGSAVKDTGLAQGTTYTYAAWIKDRAGHYSAKTAVKQLLGMKSGISVTSTLINYGGSITLKGSTLRIDNLAYAGLPVNVYVRPKNASKFTLLAALKTSSTGTLSMTHKPLVSSVYMLTFPGNGILMGTRTADVTVQVRPTISATVSPASIRLGGTTAFSGYVAPAHYGQTVYLQQYGSKVWKSIASVKLSTSGKYAFGIKPAVRGQIAYRVYFPGDADHAPAYTVNKIVTIS